jgi:hypothetical protein
MQVACNSCEEFHDIWDSTELRPRPDDEVKYTCPKVGDERTVLVGPIVTGKAITKDFVRGHLVE